MKFGTWVQERLVTPDAVYGTILYAALIGAVSDDDESALDVLIVAAATLIIFWGAHVFAGTVATHGVKAGEDIRLRTAIGRSIRHSSGMLWAAILPSLALVLGVARVLDTDSAVSVALLISTIILGVLGYRAFAERRSPVVVRILGGVGTALFGALMIVLNIIVH